MPHVNETGIFGFTYMILAEHTGRPLNISHGSVSLEKKVFLAEEKQAKLKAEQSAENNSPPAPQENAASVEVLK
jgi:hypothetical protein